MAAVGARGLSRSPVCPNCDGFRRGTLQAQARTQSSIAASANGQDWLRVNASPDGPAQIRANPELQSARSVRDSGMAAVLLMDAQIDHVTGLLMLRERASPLPLPATPEVLSDLVAKDFPSPASCRTTAATRTFELKQRVARLIKPHDAMVLKGVLHRHNLPHGDKIIEMALALSSVPDHRRCRAGRSGVQQIAAP